MVVAVQSLLNATKMGSEKWLLVAIFIFQLIYISQSAITVEQMQKSMTMVRSVCQPKTKITDELADGINQAKLPDDKSLKCYIQCVLEMSGMMKKNKITYEAAIKQFDMLLPDEMRDSYKNSLTICKDSANGIKDSCEAAYAVIKCMFKENKDMMFP